MAEIDALRPLAGWATATAGLSGAAAGAVYFLVVWRIARGELTLGDLALYGGTATLLRGTLTGVTNSLVRVVENFRFLPSLWRVLEAARPALPPADRRACAAPDPAGHRLRARGVHVSGADCASAARRFAVHRAGRVRCASRSERRRQDDDRQAAPASLRPDGGRILLDGVDLREYDLADLRREMGVIFQDFVRYEATAGENIAIGQIDALRDEGRVLAATARAGADEVLSKLRRGWRRRWGVSSAAGELSGGEWQKLALARAFVREAQVLVLDEPTAALDVPTEHAVYTRFRELTRGRTTLLISHRFSTVRMADRILFLAEGAIKEEGSHDELLARGGEYARLYELQAAQYQSASQDRSKE